MKNRVTAVIRNSQGDILLVENGHWSLPHSDHNTDTLNVSMEEVLVRSIYQTTGIILESFNHKGDFLYDSGICYRVYHTAIDIQITKIISYLWVNESNLPANIGSLTKAQLRKELNPNNLSLYGTANLLK